MIFFFTTWKCELCIKAKGTKSWTDYRLALMTQAARELMIDAAKKVNPKIKVVIKYPNWYDHFQGNGFNLETEPKMFDGLYTGTETRDPSENQHLQPYLGYLIFRYFDNLKPGKNGGGWVDPGGLTYMDRYAEQLWLTMFAKAPEITLFDIRQLQRPLLKTDRAAWQNLESCSFNFDEMMNPVADKNGKMVQPTTIARAAGYTFETIDKFLGHLGNPVGVKSYKPFHSTCEDFLQNYMGMIGVSMDIVSAFDGTNGWPMIHRADYAKGKLYVLTIPENVIDLYRLPAELLTRIKEILTPNMPALLEAPGLTSLFVYDNNTVIVESFADETQQVKLRLSDGFSKAKNLVTGQEIQG